jgi:DNA modification methylase
LGMEIKTFKIEDLVEYARNPRKNDAAVDRMVSCIREFGFKIPIVAKSDGSVIDGHLRLKAAKKLGMTEVPVVMADDLTEAQIKAFRLIANQSANWAEWDDELLKLELEDLKNLNFDLDLTGFDLEEVEQLLRNDEVEEDDYDEMPPEDSPVISKPGDLWMLGKHRLLCGDSTKIEDVKKLMAGKIADMVFCDPPYNVRINSIIGIGSVHHDEFRMASGEMNEREFIDFLTIVFKNLAAVSKDGSIHYHCMDWKHVYEIMVAGRSVYKEFKQICIWNKDKGGMGCFYRSKHELIFVFKNGTGKHTNNFDLGEYGRYRTNVWDYPSVNSFAVRERVKIEGAPERNVDSEELKMHPTVKPVKLIADAILDCSSSGELILDLFGGSGTTLISCEETDRRCCVMELDQKYVDTAVRRWQKHTGEEAILESTGKTFEEEATTCL